MEAWSQGRNFYQVVGFDGNHSWPWPSFEASIITEDTATKLLSPHDVDRMNMITYRKRFIRSFSNNPLPHTKEIKIPYTSTYK
jgi:hypothetical protein